MRGREAATAERDGKVTVTLSLPPDLVRSLDEYAAQRCEQNRSLAARLLLGPALAEWAASLSKRGGRNV